MESDEKMTPQEVGQHGEHLAASYLEDNGYEIVSRNWKCNLGEVDIIAIDRTRRHSDSDVHVLCEVKSRRASAENKYVIPELAVDKAKQEKYRLLALMYLIKNPTIEALRFDVIAVNVFSKSSCKIRHLVSAFSWDEQ